MLLAAGSNIGIARQSILTAASSQQQNSEVAWLCLWLNPRYETRSMTPREFSISSISPD